jgi:hypothetical protein
MSKEAYEYVVNTLAQNGSMSTQDAIDLVRPHYDFDPAAARERELRRYVGQIIRSLRDNHGTRIAFMEKNSSEIVNIDTCTDAAKVSAIETQLKVLAVGNFKSYRKAAKRRFELIGQMSMFNELDLLRGLSKTG